MHIAFKLLFLVIGKFEMCIRGAQVDYAGFCPKWVRGSYAKVGHVILN